jgi:phage terminase Nu1 subunit (DNA packaging protein)
VADLDGTMTQAAFGALVGISQQAVSDLLSREVIRAGDAGRAWLLAYCEHLRTVAAGRDPDGELSVERARVARATAEKLEMANKVTKREFAPVPFLEIVLGHVARQISTRLDALVPHIRRRLPDLPASVLAQISAEVAACRELCAAANLADADRLAREGDDDDDVPQEPAA